MHFLFLGFILLFALAPDTPQPPSGMVLIASGAFIMGKAGDAEDCPPHEVSITAFYLDATEVTNAEYQEFCTKTGRSLPEFWGIAKYKSGADFPKHPVVGVSWLDAEAYGKWAGKRLPTEAEWEYAARGGLQGRDFPAGDSIGPGSASITQAGKTTGSVPVRSFAANGYGAFDMSGNVCEWVADFYDPGYYRVSTAKDPKGPGKGKFRVIRGGGWHSGPYCNRVYVRNALPPGWLDINVGFRCAKDLGR